VPRDRIHFFFLNIGYLLDHFFVLIFATVAALVLAKEWDMTYSELIPYATPSFVAFGVCSLASGWIADLWSRRGMMAVFFVGIGASSILASVAQSPMQIGAALLVMGVFASIYHPVGLALVIEGRDKTGLPIAINGIYGNLGVGAAALLTGILIDTAGWRAAFLWPGIASILIGLAYLTLFGAGTAAKRPNTKKPGTAKTGGLAGRRLFADNGSLMIRIIAIVFISTALGGMIYQSTTFALPKIFDERLGGMAISASLVGWYAFLVFAVAGLAQIVVGFLVDRFPLRTIFTIVAALQMVFFLSMPGLEDWAAILVALAFMLAVFGQIPINDVLVSRIAHSDWRSRIFAIRYIVTFSALALAIPMIAWIYGSWGFDTLFSVLAGASTIILATVIWLPVQIPSPAPEAVAAAE